MPDIQPVLIFADDVPVSTSDPLPVTVTGGGGGTSDQGKSNGDATDGWSARLTDGAAFIVPAKTGQFPAALGATTAAGSVSVGIATDQLLTLATTAKQDTGNASLASIDTKLTAPLSVGGEITATGAAASGAAVSGNPVLVAGSNTGTVRTVSVDASGQQVVVGPGTAGSASGGVLTVQGVASMTPVQVGDNSSSLTVDSAQLPATLGQATAANSLSVVFNSNQVGTAGSSATTVLSVQGIASGTNLPVSQATAANLNATVTGSGSAGTAAAGVVTVQGIASMTPVQVSQATASNLNAQVVGAGASGAAVSGNPVLTAGSDGTNARTLSTDTSGRQRNAGATGFSYITAATTTTVKSSAGVLRAVHITAAFSAGSLSIYNANGTATNPIAGFGTNITQSFLFNLECSNGITVVTGASFNGQVTVVYD